MVSTRGVRYKFTEGERVLCYEPDPTKAKVLYDSKVLEVIENKDKRGRRSVEYLIHFQGWNSSWDRCVSEDFVLKDTEENRQLQRDLAEKSQLQLGAYLYRRERKKGSTSSAGAGPAKRPRHGFSDDGSSSSTQPDEADGEQEGDGRDTEGGGETGDTDSSSGSGGSQPRSPPPNAPLGRAHITLPNALRDRLTFDYHLVVKRGRLSRLPASPCAAQILESFVKWFARAGAWHPARGRSDPPQKPDLLDVSCRLNLVREVADGLRVYFDFILRGHLLYKQELNQYHEICGQFIDEQEQRIKEEYEDEDHLSQDEESQEGGNSAEDDLKSPKIPEYSHLPPDPVAGDNEEVPQEKQEKEDEQKLKEEIEIEIKQEIKQEPIDDEPQDQTLDDSHEYIEPVDIKKEKEDEKEEVSEIVKDIGKDEAKKVTKHISKEETKKTAKDIGKEDATKATDIAKDELKKIKEVIKEELKDEIKMEIKEEREDSNDKVEQQELPAEESIDFVSEVRRETRPGTRRGNQPRRLRSHRSAVSQSENEEPQPSTSTAEPRAFEAVSSSVCSSGSSMSESWARHPPAAPAATAPTRTPLSLLLDKVAKWQIIPREGTEHLPCRVYGAIHLARLFVKLPDFLNATQMPDFKLKLIVKHIDMFVQYMEEHSEWFGEPYYFADTFSRST